MYGMLLESVQHFVQKVYGEDIWTKVLEHADMRNTVFTPHARYSDSVIIKLAESCSEVIRDKTQAEFIRYFGKCFVGYFTHYGYDRILRVSGRHFRDLLHGIDNLHETMRFSYPKMRNPSFYVDHEDTMGCILHYRSKRKGFSQYVAGQLEQCAKTFYHMEIDIVILKEEISEKGCHVTYRLNFDNSAFKPKQVAAPETLQKYKSISTRFFFKVFPFCIVFNEGLEITHTGPAIRQLFAHETLIGSNIKNKFILRRPMMEFTWNNILCLQRVVFELKSVIHTRYSISTGILKTLLLKGEMKYNKDLGGITYLCAPLMSGIDELQAVGLYINELNMYDSSREMVIAGSQHASRLELSIEKQVDKSKQIEASLKKLDHEKQENEKLLYSMIPRSIAVRLMKGENPIQTCEVFEQVTIMFTYIVGFAEMCSSMSVINFVQCISEVFRHFDDVLDAHDVFKVETLGDAVYMIAGGLPERKPNHAYKVACVAIELANHVRHCTVPKEMNTELQIRTGIHTGSVVAGVVGKIMPQYCLFGDTVNTASRMQTHSQPGRIHISESSYKCLKGTDLVTVYRGKIHMKGKGDMKTYWLAGHKSDNDLVSTIPVLKSEAASHKLKPLQYQRSKDSFNFRKIDTVINFKSHKMRNGQHNLKMDQLGILERLSSHSFTEGNCNIERRDKTNKTADKTNTGCSFNIDKAGIFMNRKNSLSNVDNKFNTNSSLPRIATHPSAEGRKFMPRTASHPLTYQSKIYYGSLFNSDYENTFKYHNLASYSDTNKLNGEENQYVGESIEETQTVGQSIENNGGKNQTSIIDFSYFDSEQCSSDSGRNSQMSDKTEQSILASREDSPIKTASREDTPIKSVPMKKSSVIKKVRGDKKVDDKKLSGKVKSTFSGILSHCSFSLCIDAKLNNGPNKSSENLVCSPDSADSDFCLNPESSVEAKESDYLLHKVNKPLRDGQETGVIKSSQWIKSLKPIANEMEKDPLSCKITRNMNGDHDTKSDRIHKPEIYNARNKIEFPNKDDTCSEKEDAPKCIDTKSTKTTEVENKPELLSKDAPSRVNGNSSQKNTVFVNGRNVLPENAVQNIHTKHEKAVLDAITYDKCVQATPDMKTHSTSCENIAVKNQYVQTDKLSLISVLYQIQTDQEFTG